MYRAQDTRKVKLRGTPIRNSSNIPKKEGYAIYSFTAEEAADDFNQYSDSIYYTTLYFYEDENTWKEDILMCYDEKGNAKIDFKAFKIFTQEISVKVQASVEFK